MPLPRKLQAVVFDMDGLLFDTEVLYRDTILAAAARRGRAMDISVYLKMVGLPVEGSRAVCMEHFGPDFDFATFWAEVIQEVRALADTQLRLKAGVVELLDLLDEARLPRAIATSSRREAVDHHLGVHGLTHRFHTIVAKGDYAQGKPHPEPYLTAAARLGVDPAGCLALEDSHNGVRSAAAAGMMTIMVPDLLTATAEIEALCVTVSESLHHVRALVTRHLAAAS
ncbi:MAG: HAD family phosphatase [Verrucomicrobium sp.]|nr:HAD family phosphatase [Verrucomicrobium sp.]